MILKQFPNLQWLKQQAEKSFENGKRWDGHKLPHSGWPTVVLNVTTSHTYRDNIRGPLSIFTNISGSSFVESGKRQVKVNEDFFFVTNHDQYYTLAVEGCKTETFNIHFGEYFADEIFQAMSAPARVLDSGTFAKPVERIEFHNSLYPKNELFHAIIRSIQEASADDLLREEKLAELMIMLVATRNEHARKTGLIPAIRNSTREEIMRRLFVAADYIHSNYQDEISLDALASACCLSKFHFLRLFKIAFERTPHQYLNDVRIMRAKHLLRDKKIELTTISPLVGLKDASSFSRLFYRHVGVYPSEYRRRV